MKNNKTSRDYTIAASQSFKEREYWEKKLSGELVKSTLPYDYKNIKVDEPRMDSVKFRFSGKLFSNLMRLNNGSDPRLHMILTAGLVVLTNKYMENTDIILGMPVRKQEVRGEFINTILAIRSHLEENITFKKLLLQVRKTIFEAIENQNYPMDALVYDLGLTFNKNEFPLFEVVVLLENIHDKKYIQHINCNTVFSFLRKDDCIEGKLEYNSLLFEKKTIERIINHLKILLEQVLDNINIKTEDVDILSSEEKTQLLFDFSNRTIGSHNNTGFPGEKTIQELFQEQVEKIPGNAALIFENKQCTYDELNVKANRLAHTLRAKGVKPGTVVGIMVERSIEMIVGMLGILKAGGAYLPIDPEYPLGRVEYIIKDSELNLLLSKHNMGLEMEFIIELIDLESDESYREECTNPDIVNNGNDSAYIIYTSGSTGKPKGVVIEHHSIVNTLFWRKNYYQFDHTDAVLQIPSFSFDSSVEDIFTPLISGSRLILIQEQNRFDMEYLAETIKRNEITHFLIIPNLYRTFLQEIPGTLEILKSITVAGDNFTEELVKEHFDKLEHVKLVNEYGPTENSVCSTVYEFNSNRTRVLIGKPINNVSCYILGRKKNLQPIGVPGELFLSGKGLARGYYKRPELTAEKFDKNPYIPGERMYKTGDLARWLPDGNIEFLGRIDDQVKIRGFRIELGEIEIQLLKHNEIKEAVVIAKEDDEGNKYLCAYIVLKDNDIELNVSNIIEFLSTSLPGYMIPPYIFKIEKIPLTPNGKIDRKRLPEADEYIDMGEEYIAPGNETEEALAEIWKKELNLEKIGIKDNYFNIGGDSIKSIKLINSINKKFNRNLKIFDLYINNTIENLALLIDKEEIISFEEKHSDTILEIEDLKKRIIMGKQYGEE